MDKKAPQKNPCTDCTFCQYCCDSRCAICRIPERKKRGGGKGPKVHKPLFLKF